MNKTAFASLLESTYTNLQALTGTKGAEYSRSDTDQLANFKRQAEENGTVPEVICNIYLTKHLDSIKYHVKQTAFRGLLPQGGSEPIEGRIDDAILYLVLMKGIIQERRDGEHSSGYIGCVLDSPNTAEKVGP